MLLDGDNLPRIIAVVRSYIGDEPEWDLRLALRRGTGDLVLRPLPRAE